MYVIIYVAWNDVNNYRNYTYANTNVVC